MADNQIFNLMQDALFQLLTAPLPEGIPPDEKNLAAQLSPTGGLAHRLMAALIDKGLDGNIQAIKQVLALTVPAEYTPEDGGIVDELCRRRSGGFGWQDDPRPQREDRPHG